MAKTKIEWTDENWNPTVGCSRASVGCSNCYAERMARRLQAMGRPEYQSVINSRGRWTGKVAPVPSRLEIPLHWKKPRRVFVDSMSDLFHEHLFESGNESFIDEVFAIMAATPHITYQVLTKRPGNMLKYMNNKRRDIYIEHALETIYGEKGWCAPEFEWPLPNVQLGASVENQDAANDRVPLLLKTLAAVRFLSCEPLLGPVDISLFLNAWHECSYEIPPIDWVIVGGESGPYARAMHPDWVRSLRDQCKAANVPLFFKQWGEWAPPEIDRYGPSEVLPLDGSCTSNRQYIAFPDGQRMERIGKSLAGHLLDGEIWKQFPK